MLVLGHFCTTLFARFGCFWLVFDLFLYRFLFLFSLIPLINELILLFEFHDSISYCFYSIYEKQKSAKRNEKKKIQSSSTTQKSLLIRSRLEAPLCASNILSNLVRFCKLSCLRMFLENTRVELGPALLPVLLSP